jgi:hypothetical protein
MNQRNHLGKGALRLAALVSVLVLLGCPVEGGKDSTETVAAPTASPAPGAVAPGTAVTLSTATPGAFIYYTLDGAAPTRAATLYAAPIPITAALTIKAVAVKEGMDDSGVLTAAYTVEDNGPREIPLPPSSGANLLAGTIYYGSSKTSSNLLKIQFNSNGTYQASQHTGNTALTPKEEGTYSWDQGAATVTLKPSKVAIDDDNGQLTGLLTRTEYRTIWQERIDTLKAEMDEDTLNALLAGMGFADAAAAINYQTAQDFGNRTYNYAFSGDQDNILFMDEPLPSSTGPNEVDGETYHPTTGSGDSRAKDTNRKYTFTGNGYSFTDTPNPANNHSGTYAYDGQHHAVWFKPSKVGSNLDRAAYYTSLKSQSPSPVLPPSFPSLAPKDIIAYYVNRAFSVTQHGYNPEDKTL